MDRIDWRSSLNVDWKVHISGADPYFIWADVTAGKGIYPLGRQLGKDPAFDLETNAPKTRLPILIELTRTGMEVDRDLLQSVLREAGASALSLNPLSVGWPARQGVEAGQSRFVTGSVGVSNLKPLAERRANRLGEYIHAFEVTLAAQSSLLAGISEPGGVPLFGVGGRVIACIDYGCPFANSQFADNTGRSRIRYFWNQGLENTDNLSSLWREVIDSSNPAVNMGAELDSVAIASLVADHTLPSGAVDERALYEAIGYETMRTQWTHGAHVLDVAAGFPDPTSRPHGQLAARSLAEQAALIFVELPYKVVADASGGNMPPFVVAALEYIACRTIPTAQVAINMSYGTYAGPHDGSSLLEKAIDEFCKLLPRFKVVLPVGNSYQMDCHAQLQVAAGASASVGFELMPDDPTDSFVEIWYEAGPADSPAQIEVSLRPPRDGSLLGPAAINDIWEWESGVIIHIAGATTAQTASTGRPPKINNQVLVAINPTLERGSGRKEAPYGIWELRIRNKGSKAITLDAWVQRDEPIFEPDIGTRQPRFVVDPQDAAEIQSDHPPQQPVRKTGTLNSYATGHQTLVAGGCRASDDSLASYSSAGPCRRNVKLGPDCVFPCDVSPTLPGRLATGNYSGMAHRMAGTSVAAPMYTRTLVDAAQFGQLPSSTLPPNAKPERWGKGRLTPPESTER